MKMSIFQLGVLIFMTILTTNAKALSCSFKTSDDVTIDYEVTGEGEALVMLHSGMMSRDDMSAQVKYFSNFYKVIAIDAREQGRSSSSPVTISYNLMSKDVIEILDYLNIEKASFFGQSDGGVTALVTTHLHQNRINKLIIHGAVYHFTAYPKAQRDGWKNSAWNESNASDHDPAGFPGTAISSYLLGQSDLSNFEAHFKEMSNMWATSPSLTDEDLAAIKVPTMVIVGDHNDISLQHTIKMHEALSNSELFVAPGATHFIHQEKPDLLNKIIHDFLKQ